MRGWGVPGGGGGVGGEVETGTGPAAEAGVGSGLGSEAVVGTEESRLASLLACCGCLGALDGTGLVRPWTDSAFAVLGLGALWHRLLVVEADVLAELRC